MNDLFLGVIVELSQVDIELYFQEQLSYLSRKYSWNDPWSRSAGNAWPEYSCVDLQELREIVGIAEEAVSRDSIYYSQGISQG